METPSLAEAVITMRSRLHSMIAEEQKKAEEKIFNAISEFEKNTSLKVNGIGIKRFEVGGNSDFFTVKINTDLW